MRFSSLSFIILFLITGSLFANEQPDTSTQNTDTYLTEKFLENLDSLSELWYIKQAINLKVINPDYGSLTDSTEIPEFSDKIYQLRLANIPSVIALPYNDKVKAFIKLYTEKRRGLVEVMLGMSDYYFPLITEILEKEGLPHEFKYLPLIESALNPRAVSRVGATGLWQFMYTTGKVYGLEVNSYVDERRDPVKASYAAAAFLKDLYELYGDWTLALAAYNCGPGNVNKAIRRAKGKTDFWDIYYYLPRETRGYVPSFIAATYFMNYYQEHRLKPVAISLPTICDTIMVDQEVHLQQIASVLDVDIEMLRDLNPQYKTDIIPAKTKKYVLKLPAQLAPKFIELEDSIYNYKDSVYFNPARAVAAPPANYSNHAYTPKSIKGKTLLYYTVKSGDNLGFISQWYHVRLSDIRYWNNLHGNMIRAGQKLKIFVSNKEVDRYEKIEHMTFDQKQRSIGVSTSTTSGKTKSTTSKTTSKGKVTWYTVRPGDSPYIIAKKFPGVSDSDIMRWNHISNPKSLKVGQKLKIIKP